ncbi:type II toxin-antitoxin system Phd/YefM family antitoxin [Lacticaseibacillus suihuaensis]
MKILDVPTVSTTDVKKSPAEVAKLAEKLNTGVYVLNRGKAISVTLTPDQYRELVEDQELLLDLQAEQQARLNLSRDNGHRTPIEAVVKNLPKEIDPDDGWE